MKNPVAVLLVILLTGLAAGGGYWLGQNKPAPVTTQTQAPSGPQAREVLYYRNPMGLPDTSPLPKKDSMGMDYVPVYAGEEPAGPELKISLDRVQKLGVRTEPVALRDLSRTLRAVGTVQVNERLERTVALKFEGWIHRLVVSAVGERVQRGQPLMDIYSPDLIMAQQEYFIATRAMASLKEAGPEAQSLLESSLMRLRNWDISSEELVALQREGQPRYAVTIRSPVNGVVIEKPSGQGMRFMPGEKLYRIADLSSLWLLAEVFEQDMAGVRAGQAAKIRVNAYPERVFAGKIDLVYPTVAPATRTLRLRIELDNSSGLLKPDMYASVELTGLRADKRLAIPDSAVLDSGTRQLVLVQRGEGLFDPREVTLGRRGDGYVEVLNGLKAGEIVVVSANFLIDAESNLKAAVGGFTQPAMGAAAAKHAAVGRVESVDSKTGTVSVTHGPVASLKWPDMTMDFKVKDPAVLGLLKAGAKIGFEFVEADPGEWVIVRVTPPAPGAAKARAPRDSRAAQ